MPIRGAISTMNMQKLVIGRGISVIGAAFLKFT